MSGKRKRPSGRSTDSGSLEQHQHYVNHWRRARRGDRDSARYLLGTFCMAVDSKNGVPKPVLAYLQSAITRYLHGEALEQALGVARPRGRKKGSHSTMANPLDLAALFYLYRHRDGMKSVAATNRVAKERAVEPRTVERAVKDNRDLEQLEPAELEALIYDN